MFEFLKVFNFGVLFKASMVLFVVIDIVGSIPLIIKLRESSDDIRELRTSLVSLVIMIGFFLLGESILMLLGVTIQSFAVAGSLILFTLALEMILGVRLKNCLVKREFLS
jgi:multiple antibiotic resistance protein